MIFTLPLVAYGTAGFSAARWSRGGLDRQARLVNAATLVLSAAGFLAYVSPWGVEAVRSILGTYD